MKQRFWGRFMYWICDTFGHAEPDGRAASWYYNYQIHRHCHRCNRIVSEEA